MSGISIIWMPCEEGEEKEAHVTNIGSSKEIPSNAPWQIKSWSGSSLLRQLEQWRTFPSTSLPAASDNGSGTGVIPWNAHYSTGRVMTQMKLARSLHEICCKWNREMLTDTHTNWHLPCQHPLLPSTWLRDLLLIGCPDFLTMPEGENKHASTRNTRKMFTCTYFVWHWRLWGWSMPCWSLQTLRTMLSARAIMQFIWQASRTQALQHTKYRHVCKRKGVTRKQEWDLIDLSLCRAKIHCLHLWSKQET